MVNTRSTKGSKEKFVSFPHYVEKHFSELRGYLTLVFLGISAHKWEGEVHHLERIIPSY